ncbi:MAG TPA: DoxX family protein [Polyangiaceae bacterium]|nr:DoxX family protein [Polyangiaceae bacterium]
MTKARNWGLLSVSVLLAFAFAASGLTKLIGMQAHIDHFAKWGYPDWFRVFVGAAEVAGAVGILVPRTSLLACAGMGILMLGAAYTHLTNGEGAQASAPLLLLALLGYVAWSRRSTTVQLARSV